MTRLRVSTSGGNPTITRRMIMPLGRRDEQLAEDSGCLRRQPGGHPENPLQHEEKSHVGDVKAAYSSR